jgi:murein DD-endopeptidase MepM/ murein hydrolase activator NlpD
MDEIVVRPKYSRQTGTQRRRRREPDNEVMSTVFAAKLLVVVIILSVMALCKAADTPVTNFLISKVKVITITNYDSNKYLLNIASEIGIKLPKAVTPSQDAGSNGISNAAKDSETDIASVQNTDTGKTNVNNIDTSSTENTTGDVQVLYDQEIKDIASKYSMVTPIKGEIASSFGTRTYPLSGTDQFHSGVDIEANMGTSIKAALGGEIIEAGSNPEYDNYVKIKHNDDIVTVYAHCSMLIAKVGQKVNQGDVIAKVGDTEGLDGAYLHFEVWKGGKAVDPEKLLNYINQ